MSQVNYWLTFVSIVVLASMVEADPFGYKQYTKASGTLWCNSQIYNSATIRLMDENVFEPDEQIAVVWPSNGEFIVAGGDRELLPMKFYVEITHHCNGIRSCYRFYIPPHFVAEGSYSSPKIYDIGILPLEDLPNNCNKMY